MPSLRSLMARRSTVVACLVLCAGAGTGKDARAQSSSASYRLVSTTLDAAGGSPAGPSASLNGSLGQELVVGVSAGPHFVLQSGFWGFLGSTVTPVVLAVNRNPGDPDAIDLTWSGNNATYDIYRSTSSHCDSQYASVLAATSANAYTDAEPPSAPLVCYSVLAVAPGPVAPPQGFDVVGRPHLEAVP